ncbi:hypothetical protein [Streptomyces sp. NPDC007369]|uniref:hypothetical protein n=1 Tax=Streptomyces sp. NPDC007369 TaxID=3154589 RepID=UPI003403D1B5
MRTCISDEIGHGVRLGAGEAGRETGGSSVPSAFTGDLTRWKVSGWRPPGRARPKLAW